MLIIKHSLFDTDLNVPETWGEATLWQMTCVLRFTMTIRDDSLASDIIAGLTAALTGAPAADIEMLPPDMLRRLAVAVGFPSAMPSGPPPLAFDMGGYSFRLLAADIASVPFGDYIDLDFITQQNSGDLLPVMHKLAAKMYTCATLPDFAQRSVVLLKMPADIAWRAIDFFSKAAGKSVAGGATYSTVAAVTSMA